MNILVLFGPNLNLLGYLTRGKTGITLEKVQRSLRQAAKSHEVELRMEQTDAEVEGCKSLKRYRNKIDGLLLIPGIWSHTGHQLLETATLLGVPLAVYQFQVDGSPWQGEDAGLFSDLAVTQSIGPDGEKMTACLTDFVDYLSSRAS